MEKTHTITIDGENTSCNWWGKHSLTKVGKHAVAVVGEPAVIMVGNHTVTMFGKKESKKERK